MQLRYHKEVRRIARSAGSLIHMGFPDPTNPTGSGGRIHNAEPAGTSFSVHSGASLPECDTASWIDHVARVTGYRFSTCRDASEVRPSRRPFPSQPTY